MKLNNISVSFDGKAVLTNVTFAIPQKGIIALVGPSGVGKTTLFRVIAGLQKPDGGTIDNMPSRISYSFQEHRLLPWLNALQNVTCVTDTPDEAFAHQLLERLGITKEDALKTPSKLSGGMKQRVSVARAAYYMADMYLFDEPFAGLDPENVARVSALMKDLSQSAPVIVITHEQEQLLQADQTIHLEK